MDTTPVPQARNDFRDLRELINAAGLLKRGGFFYVWNIARTFGMLAIAISVLFLTMNPWLLLLDAVFLGFVFGQLGLLGHDVGHRQVFSRAAYNDCIGYPCGMAMGISAQSWMDNHNKHHAHPNREHVDPDVDFPMLAFSQQQAAEKRGFRRFITRNQGWLFPFMLPLVGLGMRLTSIKYVIAQPQSHVGIDRFCLIAHYILYFGLLFTLLPFWLAIAFIIVSQLSFGLYIGMVFAPNHKGMEVFDENTQIDFLREQVLTSRNIRSNLFTDFFYGGLNYQVEHHLFPHMSRSNLPRAQKIVRDFCAERNVTYYETGFIQGLLEVHAHMREMARYARGLKS